MKEEQYNTDIEGRKKREEKEREKKIKKEEE